MARQRLELIHLATSGLESVDAASAELGISPSYFDKLRTQAYLGAALALTPRAGGRRRVQPVVPATELHEAQRQIAELQRENAMLRAQLELASLRAGASARRPKSRRQEPKAKEAATTRAAAQGRAIP